MPSDFDQVGWLRDHNSLLKDQRKSCEAKCYTVSTTEQNGFSLRCSSAVLGGKPDVVTSRRDEGVVIEMQTGRPDRTTRPR